MIDDLFRLLLAAGFLVLGPIGGFYRYRAHHSGEKLDRRREGWPMLIALRLLGVLLFMGFLAYLIDPTWLATFQLKLPVWARGIGLVLGAVAGLLFIAVLRHLGRNLTDTVVTRRDHTLVVSGPYRWVRHPFYVAYLASVVATSMAASNGYFLLVGLPIFLLLYLRTAQEEAELAARFGDDYRAYVQRTGRFWPRW